MNEVESVTIQPNTQGEGVWTTGQGIGSHPYKRFISEIRVVDEATLPIVLIFVNGQLYAEYVNVPYVVFYKIDDTK